MQKESLIATISEDLILDLTSQLVAIYDAGIPAVNFGAGDYRVCHQPNEFVPIDELMTCAKVVMGTAVELLQSKLGRERIGAKHVV